MKRNLTRTILTALALSCLALPVYAEAVPDFDLDRVVVTAVRAETKDLDTPASVTVKTGEELQETGAKTVIDALQFIEGINIYSQNPYGQSAGRMSSELVVRGAKKGTLVMVNGAPISMNGLFQLDNILLENVEKVEVVRGAGAVLYGSEAFGGVINIITKKEVSNSVAVVSGNKGQEGYHLNLQAGKLAFSGSLINSGEVKGLTSTATTSTDFLGSEKTSLNATYRFNDKLTMNFNHLDDEMDKEAYTKSTGKLSTKYKDEISTDRVTFQYEDQDWKGLVYGAFSDLDYWSKSATGTATSNVNLKTAKYGLDANTSKDMAGVHYLTGITMEKETYEKTNLVTNANDGDFDRTVSSLYVQATKEFDENSKLLLGVRGQTAETESGDRYNQFLPQLQYNQRLTPDSSWFVNVGKAFRLPTLTELHYKSDVFVSNPNLKPESGWSYETGWKKQVNQGLFKATLFRMDFKDHIDTDANSVFQNYGKFENTGIELSWEEKLSDRFSYTVGATYSDPRQQNQQGLWERAYSRIQTTTSLRYTQDKLTANLAANYTADRANNAPNALPVSLMLNYQCTPDTNIFATMRNVLDRHDVTTNSSSYYYAMPRTVEIGVKHKF